MFEVILALLKSFYVFHSRSLFTQHNRLVDPFSRFQDVPRRGLRRHGDRPPTSESPSCWSQDSCRPCCCRRPPRRHPVRCRPQIGRLVSSARWFSRSSWLRQQHKSPQLAERRRLVRRLPRRSTARLPRQQLKRWHQQ